MNWHKCREQTIAPTFFILETFSSTWFFLKISSCSIIFYYLLLPRRSSWTRVRSLYSLPALCFHRLLWVLLRRAPKTAIPPPSPQEQSWVSRFTVSRTCRAGTHRTSPDYVIGQGTTARPAVECRVLTGLLRPRRGLTHRQSPRRAQRGTQLPLCRWRTRDKARSAGHTRYRRFLSWRELSREPGN